MNSRKLNDECKKIYKESHRLLKNHNSVVKHGLNILYGPPTYKPSVFIVTFQGAGADKIIQNSWPSKLLYDDESKDAGNRFGDNLRKAMERTKTRYLLRNAVASCVVFPQAPINEAHLWKKKTPKGDYLIWRDFSLRSCKNLIHLMKPKTIVTFGKKPFEWIAEEIRKPDKRPNSNRNILRYGLFENIYVFGSAHISLGVKNEEIDSFLTLLEITVKKAK